MKEIEYKEILENNIKIVKHYGRKKQILVWVEEMDELTKELCKWARRYDELEEDLTAQLFASLYEEITDVTICLDQLKYAIKINENDLMKEYKWKVDKQLKRIEDDKNE